QRKNQLIVFLLLCISLCPLWWLLCACIFWRLYEDFFLLFHSGPVLVSCFRPAATTQERQAADARRVRQSRAADHRTCGPAEWPGMDRILGRVSACAPHHLLLQWRLGRELLLRHLSSGGKRRSFFRLAQRLRR